MSNHNQMNFSETDVLPLLRVRVARELDDSKQQLMFLQTRANHQDVLDDNSLEQIIKSYKQKNDEIVDQRSICLRWKERDSLSTQRKIIDEIDEMILETEKVNQQVIFLAEHYINKHPT